MMCKCPVCNNDITTLDGICKKCRFDIRNPYTVNEILSYRLDFWETLYEFNIHIGDKTILEKVDNLPKMDEIIVPFGVEIIGRHAFSSCFGARKVVIPNTVKMISPFAFYNSSIEEIFFESNSALEVIGENAFENSKIREITIPKSVKKINSRAFSCCDYLKRFNCEKGICISSFGDKVFLCSGVEEVTLPDGIQTLDGEIFDQCNSLTFLHIPSTVITIDMWAESEALKLLPDDLPDSVEYINGWNDSYYDWYDDEPQQYSIFPKKLKQLGYNALSGCSYLKNIVFHKNLERIDDSAFSNCHNLQLAIIPATAQVSESAFSGCSDSFCIIRYTAQNDIEFFVK